jgi:small nuclear ribonucleoprotein (snRNP)-like protein
MKYLFIALFVLVQYSVSGQGSMQRTLDDACSCINDYTDEVANYDQYMNLIIQCASPLIVQNADELSKELGLEEMSQMEAIEAIGAKVGERLVMECPKFTEITFKVIGEDPTLMDEVMDEYDEEAEGEGMIESGTVVSVSKEVPCQITVKNDMGETLNFLWIDPIGIEEAYISYPDKLKGKTVDVVYYMGQIYSPKEGTYQSRKVLMEVNVR